MSLDAPGASQAWADWNFHAGSLDLVQRIKSVAQAGDAPWARIVGTRDDMAATREDTQVTPGVYVIYRGLVVKSANEKRAEIEHRWIVVLAIAGPPNSRESSDRDAEAGRYLPLLVQALHGYTPAGSTAPLVPATPPAPAVSGRYGYYPLLFTAVTVYSTRKGPAVGPLPLDRR